MATLEEVLAELRALREGQDALREGQDALRGGQDALRADQRQIRAEMQEGFERVELKIQKVRSDIHQLDKDLDKHMEMHRELETEIASLKNVKPPRVSRSTRPRR